MIEYKELSRRGLISMCEDFDADNGSVLYNYLIDNEPRYEHVRMPELAIDKVDQYTQVAKEAYDSFKRTAARDSDATCSRLLAKMAGKGVGSAVKFVKNLI